MNRRQSDRPHPWAPSPGLRMFVLSVALMVFVLFTLTGCGLREQAAAQACADAQRTLDATEVCSKVAGCSLTAADMRRAIDASRLLQEFCR